MKLIPTAEAAKILDVTPGSLRLILGEPEAKQARSPRGGHKTNLYSLKKVEAARKSREIKKKRVPKTGHRLRKCLACNGEFMATPYQRHCEHCRDFIKTNKSHDPYGVMVKPTYRGRKCPICGVDVATGQYKCAKYTSLDCTDHGLIDDGYIYGGVGVGERVTL